MYWRALICTHVYISELMRVSFCGRLVGVGLLYVRLCALAKS